MHYIVIFLGLVVLVFVALLVIGGGPDNDNDDNPEGGDMEEDDNDAMERGEASKPNTREQRKRGVCITRASRLLTYVGIKYTSNFRAERRESSFHKQITMVS